MLFFNHHIISTYLTQIISIFKNLKKKHVWRGSLNYLIDLKIPIRYILRDIKNTPLGTIMCVSLMKKSRIYKYANIINFKGQWWSEGLRSKLLSGGLLVQSSRPAG